jgi:hypothetical protein
MSESNMATASGTYLTKSLSASSWLSESSRQALALGPERFAQSLLGELKPPRKLWRSQAASGLAKR